jgi:hypothetical protein
MPKIRVIKEKEEFVEVELPLYLRIEGDDNVEYRKITENSVTILTFGWASRSIHYYVKTVPRVPERMLEEKITEEEWLEMVQDVRYYLDQI